jgi:hypothetical protein
MPRVNPTTPDLLSVTVGDLRRLVHAGADENLTLGDALAAFRESDRASAAHELVTRQYTAYVDRRNARHSEALAIAAAASDKAHPGAHDGTRLSARQGARLARDEEFALREPLLAFQEWIEAGRPEIHQVSAIRRAVQTVTELVQ